MKMSDLSINEQGDVIQDGEQFLVNGVDIHCYGVAREIATVNRNELIKRWNQHDKLVELLIAYTNCCGHSFVGSEAYEKAKQLLQEEQQ